MRYPIRLAVGLFIYVALASNAWALWHSEAQGIMGTEISVTLWDENTEHAKLAITSVMTEMERINQLLSPYIETSELARVNRDAATAPQKISEEFYWLIHHSLRVSALSGGAFDITFASVGWRYDYRAHQQPQENEIKDLLPAINYRLIVLDEKTRSVFFKHKNVRIDLGGIAKGYAVDNAIKILRAMGVEHASVSAGGDSYLLGDRQGRPWVVGIKNPRAEDPAAKAAIRIPLTDTAVSTSGDYERYFIDEHTGERVHHILNPKTGKSASEVTSVTILAPRGLDSDPLSTTVFVLGVEKGLELVNSLQGVDGIIIDRQGKVHYSAGLAPPEAAAAD